MCVLQVLFSLDHYGLGPEAMVNTVKRWLHITPDTPTDPMTMSEAAEVTKVEDDEVLSMDNPY